MAFHSEIRIHFDDADPAGICFFGTVFSKIHRVYEDFVEDLGQSRPHWFLTGPLAFPIRHTEANFLAPLKAMESYNVTVLPKSVSKSSFQLLFIISQGSHRHCEVTTTHVALDKRQMTKAPLPDGLADVLNQQLQEHKA